MTVITDCYTCGCNIARKTDGVPETCPTHGNPWETATVFTTIEFARSPDYEPSRCGVLRAEVE